VDDRAYSQRGLLFVFCPFSGISAISSDQYFCDLAFRYLICRTSFADASSVIAIMDSKITVKFHEGPLGIRVGLGDSLFFLTDNLHSERAPVT
jgi:hypothetical protein